MPVLALLAILALLSPGPLTGQGTDDAYADPVARALVRSAREARYELGRSIDSYTALVKQRAAVQLRMPLKDRTLARAEMAARVRWSRRGETVVHMLAGREQDPDGISPIRDIDRSNFFDPAGDRVYFGFGADGGPDEDGEEEFWIAHPLAEGSEEHYRYRSTGDTLVLRLPDGRAIRALELLVIPRAPSWHYLNASLWIEPESGALVQAVFRPAQNLDIERDTAFIDAEDVHELGKVPGMFKPMEADIEFIVMEYSLWDFQHWLPRRLAMEGYARAGVLKVPFAAEISYRVEDVTTVEETGGRRLSPEEVLAGWGVQGEVRGRRGRDGGGTIVVVRPTEDRELLESPHLPPPVWQDAPEFASQKELEELVEGLEEHVPRSNPRQEARWALHWGLGAPGLVRYNRVEGLSLGLQGRVEHPLATAAATVRLGAADLHPNAELAVQGPALGRILSLSVHHRLAEVGPGGAGLALGNSFGALVFGRDDGDYYRATGARLQVAPPAIERQWPLWTVFAERHGPAERETDWSLPHAVNGDHRFRPLFPAAEVDLAGASVLLSPWWGSDPTGVQGGVELFGEAAAGDREFARARATLRTAVPLFAGLRLGLEAGGGSAWGEPPLQYHWFLGGPSTLRGYGGAAAVGASFLRGRLELARSTGSYGTVLFADAGWAGDRQALEAEDALLSAGVGVTILDGLFRADLARALEPPTGWRLEIYLDALL